MGNERGDSDVSSNFIRARCRKSLPEGDAFTLRERDKRARSRIARSCDRLPGWQVSAAIGRLNLIYLFNPTGAIACSIVIRRWCPSANGNDCLRVITPREGITNIRTRLPASHAVAGCCLSFFFFFLLILVIDFLLPINLCVRCARFRCSINRAELVNSRRGDTYLALRLNTMYDLTTDVSTYQSDVVRSSAIDGAK